MEKIDTAKSLSIAQSLLGSIYSHEKAAGQLILQLLGRIDELETGVKLHRDQEGDDRCHLDDDNLYVLVGDQKAKLALPPREIFLESCARYHASRQSESDLYSPKHCPGCTGHLTDVELVALDKVQISGRGTCFVFKRSDLKVRMGDIVRITYQDVKNIYKIVGFDQIRQACFDPDATPAIGVLVTEVGL